MTSTNGSGLDDNTDDEDTSSYDDTDFARVLFREEAGKEGPDPRAEFQDRCQPPFACLVCWVS